MKLPEKLLENLRGLPGYDEESFIRVHDWAEQVTSVRLHHRKGDAALKNFSVSGEVPWAERAFYLEERPSFTFDPFFHAGCYYVQEASSMFLEQAFRQLVQKQQPLKVLDLCASPGGKSTHIQSLISGDSVLVSNEVIRNRSLVLMDNIIKWGEANVLVTQNDPAAFKNLPSYFDVMVVDAPCSGSGLFRRDADAMEEWSMQNVQHCCQRQQRILADALPSLKPGGLLIYSTCSFSREEDEDVAAWLQYEMHMQSMPLQLQENWNIVESFSNGISGYRFYPDRLKGEGFFIACFQKQDQHTGRNIRKERPSKIPESEKAIIQPWLSENEMEISRHKENYVVMPGHVLDVYQEIKPVLNITYAGIALGQIMKNRLVPEHALAMSGLCADEIPFHDLEYDEAISFLQRREVNFNSSVKGWHLARYQSMNLGWMNVLHNRINNYYPKELRILKQSNDASFEK